MSTTNTQSLNFKSFNQGKDKKFIAELKKVYDALMHKPMTMKEAFVYSGVMRENICRYTATLREQNRIAVIRKRKCTITGRNNVLEFTANLDLFPQPTNQLKLF